MYARAGGNAKCNDFLLCRSEFGAEGAEGNESTKKKVPKVVSVLDVAVHFFSFLFHENKVVMSTFFVWFYFVFGDE